MAVCSECGRSGVRPGSSCPTCGYVMEEEISTAIPLDQLSGASEDFDTTELGAEVLEVGWDEEPKGPAPPPPWDALVEGHAALQVDVRYEYSAVPIDDPPVTGLLVGIDAFGSPLVKKGAGPVAHVILALDLSASMNHPEKYPVLKDAVSAMLSDLKKPDAADVLLSVVVFSRRAAVLLRNTPAKDIDTDSLFMLIEESPLMFRKYTDIAGALSHAGRIAYDQRKANRVLPIRLYLLTDGKPQDFPRSREIAMRLGRVTTDMHALAFGKDADVMILHELFSGKRGGTIKRVRKDTIAFAFERVAEVAQKNIATRCLVEMELEPGVVGGEAFRYRPARARFPAPAFREGRRFSADLGTIETDRTYQLLFELLPPECDEKVTRLGRVSVTIPGVGGSISEAVELEIPRLPAESLPGDVDNSVRSARDILTALGDKDPKTALRALRTRLRIYENERRDPTLLDLIRRAIRLLETEGNLESLTPEEHATLLSHTCTT